MIWNLHFSSATHSSILAWRMPLDGGAWQATLHGVARVGHDGATKPPPSWKDCRRALLSLFIIWKHVIQDGDDDKHHLLSFRCWLDTRVSPFPEVNSASSLSRLSLPQACARSWQSAPPFTCSGRAGPWPQCCPPSPRLRHLSLFIVGDLPASTPTVLNREPESLICQNGNLVTHCCTQNLPEAC